MNRKDRSQAAVYLAVCVVIVVIPAALGARQPGWFAPYFGTLPPWLAALVVAISGGAALAVLHRSYGFQLIDTSLSGRERWTPAIWALPFILTVTLVDVLRGFPADINVPWPWAWLFYPAMGLIAQLALHVVPFLLILLLLERTWRSLQRSTRISMGIGLVALLEGAFQISGGRSADPLLATFVLLQLVAFGIVELTLFRRYDYLAMITFRLTYYAWWHIIWGYLRLS